jgi:hypothetical protein
MLCCLLQVTLHAQEHESNFNGTFWNDLPRVQKVWFIMGYTHGYDEGATDALDIAGDKLPGNKATLKDVHSVFSADRMTFGTVVDGVDKCYSDFRNRRLDITYCIDWAILGVKGEDDQSREKLLVMGRKSGNQSQ